MNKERRAKLGDIIERLDALQAEIEDLEREEQEAFDSMPEGLQQSERGQQTEEAANTLGGVDLSDAIAALSEVRDA